MATPKNPTVPGLCSHFTSMPIVHQSVQHWSWRMDTGGDLTSKWLFVRTLKLKNLCLETDKRSEPPITVRSLVSAVVLVKVYDLDGSLYTVLTVLATGLMGADLTLSLDGPKCPDWDGLQYAVRSKMEKTFFGQGQEADIAKVFDPSDTL